MGGGPTQCQNGCTQFLEKKLNVSTHVWFGVICSRASGGCLGGGARWSGHETGEKYGGATNMDGKSSAFRSHAACQWPLSFGLAYVKNLYLHILDYLLPDLLSLIVVVSIVCYHNTMPQKPHDT